MRDDEWRNWKNGRYDNRYHGVRRHAGKRSYKKIIAVFIIVIALVSLAYAYQSGLLQISNNGITISPYFTVPIQNFTSISLPKLSPLPKIQLPISIPIRVPNFTELAAKPQQLLQDVTSPQQTSQADSKKAIDYINTIRVSNGEKPISFDQRVFDVALARAKDNYNYGYFDHTNPKTGTCSYTIKSQFGLVSNEDVAENLYMEGYGSTPTLSNPSLTIAIDSWMGDFGHKHNLLFPDHVSGAVACYGGICAFEGLNHQSFGNECYTASQGEAQFGKLNGCSEDQVKQYLALETQIDAMKPQLDGMPSVATSQEQYNHYNGLVSHYNDLVNQINNFKC
jgi:uncharacterized protein YkwD